ncbi:MAG: amidohydrolase family protein [Deltaproteobacteria bacterium]|nr:amidohydrolase family protein [Deltaproteobacteria bacterium]
MIDCLIRGGSVIDGTGAARCRADVGIHDGRVVAVGQLDEAARSCVDASGLVVAPGFIDLHTHYDAQLFWDPMASPSSLHGVTTIVGGNCGFGIAPLRAEAGDYLKRMLARVEGMPLESLEAGLAWDWTSFGDWLGRMEGRLAVNAGFLAGHSTLRRLAMGEAAVGEAANQSQIAEMIRLLHEALEQGALGFSSSRAQTHHDGDGNPVPSCFATDEELLALARAVGEHPGTSLGFIPTVGPFGAEHGEIMTNLSLAAGRPLNWNALQVDSRSAALHEGQLAASDHASGRGARVVALTLVRAMDLRLNFRNGMVLDALPGWASIFGLPLPERLRALQKPAIRARLAKGALSPEPGVFQSVANWDAMKVSEVFSPANQPLVGRTLGEVAAERGTSPFELMLDLAVSEDLRTSFMPAHTGDDDESWRIRAESWTDPRTVIGGSDAGAHLDMIDAFTYTTALLGPAVRERRLLTLEEAVHQLSEVPARLEGCHADLVVFDPERIAPGRTHTRSDLPGGAARLYAEAEGVAHVFVNGTETVRDGAFTGNTPGTMLRSGRDTQFPEPSARA